MHNPLHPVIRTKRGTVVYKRKIHKFRNSDILRIAKNLAIPIFNLGSTYFQEILDNSRAQSLEEVDQQFGGGAFGGAGTTREVTARYNRILLIREVIE